MIESKMRWLINLVSIKKYSELIITGRVRARFIFLNVMIWFPIFLTLFCNQWWAKPIKLYINWTPKSIGRYWIRLEVKKYGLLSKAANIFTWGRLFYVINGGTCPLCVNLTCSLQNFKSKCCVVALYCFILWLRFL